MEYIEICLNVEVFIYIRIFCLILVLVLINCVILRIGSLNFSFFNFVMGEYNRLYGSLI